jgi:methionyl-tRNA formyltransferase
MGSPAFAVPTLQALVAAPDFDVLCVVTQPDRPKGRGKKRSPTPVKAWATTHGLRCLEMSKKNYKEVVGDLRPLTPDFVVVAAFGLILRSDILELPHHGCVNLHPSLLPLHRGVSPVQGAILAGDRNTGCTSMMIDEGVDTGDLLMTETLPIDDRDNAGSLEKKLSELGAPLIVDTLRGLVTGEVKPKKQDDRRATYTRKIKKEDGLIDWREKAETVWLKVRAMTPWPSAYTQFRDRRLIVVEAAVSPLAAERASAGTVVSLDPLVVAAGEGAVELITVKVEGKKEIPAHAFCAGYRIALGEVVGAT